MKSLFRFSALAIALTLASTLTALAAKQPGSLQIKGSDTMVNLAQAWAEAFMEKRPDSFVAVTGGGSGTGFAALIAGTCDIAMSSREIKPKESEQAAAAGSVAKEYKVGLDGLAVVVHKSNPVSSLTLQQLADIFSGKVRNWKEVGGQDRPILLLSREVNSGTHVYFKEHVLASAGEKLEFAPDALLLPSSQAIADETAHNQGAIGYFGMGYLNDALKAVAVSAKAGEPPVAPTIDNVVAGTYPISRPLFFYTKGEPEGAAKDFLEFALSDEGQRIVAETDFVPLKKG